MPITVNTLIKRRRDTEANWIANNPTLEAGEQAFSTDVRNFKFGPGAWNSLPYWIQGGVATQIQIPVTSNPFVYPTEITEFIPPFRVMRDTGAGLQSWPSGEYIEANGDITVTVDYLADDYVLVVG